MQSSIFFAYQQRLQWMLFRVATLTCLGLGATAILFALPARHWPRLLFGILALGCGLLLWQCGRWVARGQRPQLAVRLSVGTLLLLASYATALAPAQLPGTGVFANLLVLQFVSRVDHRRMAWVWCSASSLLYTVATLIRRSLLGDPLFGDFWLILATYVFPCLFFFLYTLVGLDVTRHLRETEEKSLHLEQNLLDRTWEYRQLVQSMNEGFVVVDENEVFRYVNDRFCEMLGLTSDAVLNRRNQEVIRYNEANLAILRGETARRAQNQRSTYELQAARPDGRVVTVLVSAMPNFDSTGNYRGAFCVVTDISDRKAAEEALKAERAQLSLRVEERTASLQAANEALSHELAERKQAELALRAAEEDHRLLFNSVPIGLYRSTLDGRMLRANPALVKLNGYGSEAEMLAGVTDIAAEWYVDPNRRAEFKRILEEQGSIANFESEIYRYKARERIWISETAVLVRDLDGNPLYYQGTVEDIRARKQVELQQQRLITELARVAQMKDEFLASISHELRTPLNSILSIAEVLREQIYGTLNTRQLKALDTVESSGQHLLSLINDILDLAKMEAGQLELVSRPVEVNAVCQASIRLVQMAAQKKKIRIYFTPDANVTLLMADELRLKQILINLLGNAIKFTPERGAIGLEVLGQPGSQPLVQFIVWDTGVGIPQAAMDDLFKPFVQIDSRLARQHEGSGLGLALVQRLASLHGGQVTVESEVERGSRFIVTLPWHAATTAGQEARPSRLPARPTPDQRPAEAKKATTKRQPAATLEKGGPLILLIANDPVTVQMISDYLCFKHYRVAVAQNLDQAFASMQQVEPALILMDLQTSDPDEQTITQEFSADALLRQLPLIFLTASTVPKPGQHFPSFANDAYLTKPVSLKRLVQTIDAQLARRTESPL